MAAGTGGDEPRDTPERPEEPAPTKVAALTKQPPPDTKQAPATKQTGRQPADAQTKARQQTAQARQTTSEPDTKAAGGRAGATPREAGGRAGGRGGATRDPARARTLAATAERHWAQGDFQRALSLYEQAANLDPSEPTYQRQIGLANLSLGNEARAVAPLRRYLQMAPDAPDRPMIESLIRQHGR